MHGAALRLSFSRTNWTKENFVHKYGDRVIQTSSIPYQESFDTTAAPKTTTMREYIASWGKDDERWEADDVPEYMFSGQFASENPDLDDDMPEFLSLLGSLPYPSKVMAKQLFVGPAMSGAPLHWHNTAMNAIAYGRKHWCVNSAGPFTYTLKVFGNKRNGVCLLIVH